MKVETIVNECMRVALIILDNKRHGDKTKPLLEAKTFGAILDSVALILGLSLKSSSTFKVFQSPPPHSPVVINTVKYYPVTVQYGHQNINTPPKLTHDSIWLDSSEYRVLFTHIGWDYVGWTYNRLICAKILKGHLERVFTLIAKKYYNFMCFEKWGRSPSGTKLLVRTYTHIVDKDEYDVDGDPNSLLLVELKEVDKLWFTARVNSSDTTDCKKSFSQRFPWESVVGFLA